MPEDEAKVQVASVSMVHVGDMVYHGVQPTAAASRHRMQHGHRHREHATSNDFTQESQVRHSNLGALVPKTISNSRWHTAVPDDICLAEEPVCNCGILAQQSKGPPLHKHLVPIVDAVDCSLLAMPEIACPGAESIHDGASAAGHHQVVKGMPSVLQQTSELQCQAWGTGHTLHHVCRKVQGAGLRLLE